MATNPYVPRLNDVISGNLPGIPRRAPGALIKKITPGTITITDTNTSNSLTVDELNLDTTYVSWDGCYGDSTLPRRVFSTVFILNSTTITAQRNQGNAGEDATVKFQIIEFETKPKQIITGFLSFSLSSVETATIPEVNLDKAEIVLNGFLTANANGNEIIPALEFNSSTEIQGTVGANTTMTVRFTVIEHA